MSGLPKQIPNEMSRRGFLAFAFKATAAALLTACGIKPSSEPESTKTPTPTSTPTPEPSPTPTSTPTPEPSPTPTSTPTPEEIAMEKAKEYTLVGIDLESFGAYNKEEDKFYDVLVVGVKIEREKDLERENDPPIFFIYYEPGDPVQYNGGLSKVYKIGLNGLLPSAAVDTNGITYVNVGQQRFVEFKSDKRFVIVDFGSVQEKFVQIKPEELKLSLYDIFKPENLKLLVDIEQRGLEYYLLQKFLVQLFYDYKFKEDKYEGYVDDLQELYRELYKEFSPDPLRLLNKDLRCIYSNNTSFKEAEQFTLDGILRALPTTKENSHPLLATTTIEIPVNENRVSVEVEKYRIIRGLFVYLRSIYNIRQCIETATDLWPILDSVYVPNMKEIINGASINDSGKLIIANKDFDLTKYEAAAEEKYQFTEGVCNGAIEIALKYYKCPNCSDSVGTSNDSVGIYNQIKCGGCALGHAVIDILKQNNEVNKITLADMTNAKKFGDLPKVLLNAEITL
ncbi:MAG: hypothetical protein QXM68_03645 [Candidatus Aenigmatarchaeota archaeon]|nr:hypothetical protein [Candidatus Aenigmarchaeota archaeon]